MHTRHFSNLQPCVPIIFESATIISELWRSGILQK